MRTRCFCNGLAAVTIAMTLGACGGSTPSSSTGGGGSTGGTGGGGGTPTPTTTITITSNGVSPSSITVAPGSRVTFVNSDSRTHEMNSDPHPEHTDCTQINDVGFLSAGQSKTTGNLNTARTCRYHDHNDPFNTRLQGSIVIQ